MKKNIFLFLALISIWFGSSKIFDITKEFIHYKQNTGSLFQSVSKGEIIILDSKYITFSASNQSIVNLIFFNKKEIAVLGMPNEFKSIIIKRDIGLDSVCYQVFSKNVPTYRTIKNTTIYFLEHYLIGLILILMGLIFFVAFYVLVIGHLNQ